MYATIEFAPKDQKDFAIFLERHIAKDLSNGQWNRLYALCKNMERALDIDIKGYKCEDGVLYNPYKRTIQWTRVKKS